MNRRQPDVRATALQNLVPVHSLSDLEWLVKESEMLRNAPGRTFVVAGADRPAFRVRLADADFEIVRIDHGPCEVLRASPHELIHHTLGNALACGLLFTEALQ
jgi:hypothetical protein